MAPSVHIDNKNKYILILGEEPTQGLGDTTLITEAKYPINFTQSRKRFALCLHYNGSNSFLFINATKIYEFKAKDSEIKDYTLCLGNISKEFPSNNLNENRIKKKCDFFSVDFSPNDTNDILHIYRYLMKGNWYKIMFRLIKKMFMGLLISIVNASNNTKYLSLSNQKWMIQPTLINLRPNEFS